MKTVKKITEEYLKNNGYDGLKAPMGECACSIIEGCGGLMPCDGYVSNCEPGWQIRDKTGEFDFLITTKKPSNINR
jgi:hypothetical protein